MLKVLELSDNLKRHALHEKNRKHLFNYFLSQLKSFRIKSTLVTIYESNKDYSDWSLSIKRKG